TLDLNLDPKPSFAGILTAAGYFQEPGQMEVATINYLAFTTEGKMLVVTLRLPPELMTLGEVPFHGVETFGVVILVESVGNEKMLGFIGGGSIVFTSVGTDNGDVIEGSFSGLFAPRPGIIF
ncbi:MAG: hypothetical protein JRJ20_01870, partial [Deltaproteobacteria bacterium]|nr:hypothetical protein [Deltaproteobacteria bacterium]